MSRDCTNEKQPILNGYGACSVAVRCRIMFSTASRSVGELTPMASSGGSPDRVLHTWPSATSRCTTSVM